MSKFIKKILNQSKKWLKFERYMKSIEILLATLNTKVSFSEYDRYQFCVETANYYRLLGRYKLSMQYYLKGQAHLKNIPNFDLDRLSMLITVASFLDQQYKQNKSLTHYQKTSQTSSKIGVKTTSYTEKKFNTLSSLLKS